MRKILVGLARLRDRLKHGNISSLMVLIGPIRRAIGHGPSRNNEVEKSIPQAATPTSASTPQNEGSEHSAQTRRRMQNNRARRRVNNIRGQLYKFGFIERAVRDLEALAADDSRPLMKRHAAWELAVWHANQESKTDARRCLEYLKIAPKAGNGGPVGRRRATVLEAEALETLGELQSADEVICRVLNEDSHVDLFLARANIETSMPARLGWINEALELHGKSKLSWGDSSTHPSLDCLEPQQGKLEQDVKVQVQTPGQAKVTIIVPVYDSEDVVGTALESVLSQTWTNLEILVVDDASTDNTALLVQEYVTKDPRVRLIRAQQNGGAYVARNLALAEATGVFVTCHDADDYSHPEKIETQVRHLLDNPTVVANTSQQLPVTPDLRAQRRGHAGFYMLRNGSSLMFDREAMMEAIGYWDRVRFAADREFRKRLEKVFGEDSVVDLESGPLAFTRQSKDSLTASAGSSIHEPMGARKEYHESFEYFHETIEDIQDLRYGFAPEARPFAVPDPMLPAPEAAHKERRHFDVIIASDFRLPGGTTSSNAEEIKAQRRLGLRTGLIQMSRYPSNPEVVYNRKIRDQVDGEQVQMLVYGEKVTCDTLILRHPPIAQEWQEYIPDVEAKDIRVIVNQTPMREYGEAAQLAYTIGRCEKHFRKHFGQAGVWHPIGPLIREAFHLHHEEELAGITLASEDWSNIIDINEWRREARPPRDPRVRIGRHSRDADIKWPANSLDLLAAYPDSEDYEVHVLGGAEAPRKMLGGLPENWRVLEFGAVHPKDFLATLDVFVYYTHQDLVEAFGRAIIEAMAVGVPTILPHDYRKVFVEAAIYAEPSEVRDKIERLMADDDYYESQVKTAHDYIETHFGYTRHAARLRR